MCWILENSAATHNIRTVTERDVSKWHHDVNPRYKANAVNNFFVETETRGTGMNVSTACKNQKENQRRVFQSGGSLKHDDDRARKLREKLKAQTKQEGEKEALGIWAQCFHHRGLIPLNGISRLKDEECCHYCRCCRVSNSCGTPDGCCASFQFSMCSFTLRRLPRHGRHHTFLR